MRGYIRPLKNTMHKSLQIIAIILSGLVFVSAAYLISTYWSNYRIIPVSIIAYASFISLILLKDKTKIFSNIFEWFWNKFFVSLGRLIVTNILLALVLIFISWRGYNQYKAYNYNAYLTVFNKNSADYKPGESVELFNLMTKEKITVKTDETGRGIFHIDIPSVWQKTYNNYRFPEEKIESTPYGFKIDLATYKSEAILIKDSLSGSNQKIGIYQIPSDYVKYSSSLIINSKKIKSSDYLISGISNIESFVERGGFIVNYNRLLKVPNCVAYKIYDSKNEFERRDRFKIDKELQSASPESYKGSGYDRGTLIASRDMFCHGINSVRNIYFTSVVAPQALKMNRLTWNKLEQYTRNFALDTVYVIAGTLFLNSDNKGNTLFPVIGDDKIGVPSHFYRIIARNVNGKIEALAFIVPNSNEVDKDFTKYLVSVKTIEEKTGLVFFNELSPSAQKFKEVVPATIWE